MRICVRVIPRASKNSVERISDTEYKVRLMTPPIDGKANEKLIELLSKHFHVAKSLVSIVGGKNARIKMIDITF